jgi:hypothetical protein
LPFVSPLTVIGDPSAVLVPVVPPLPDVQDDEYVRIGSPPSLAGGLKVTTIWALPRATVGCGGAPGTLSAKAGTPDSATRRQPAANAAV